MAWAKTRFVVSASKSFAGAKMEINRRPPSNRQIDFDLRLALGARENRWDGIERIRARAQNCVHAIDDKSHRGPAKTGNDNAVFFPISFVVRKAEQNARRYQRNE